MMLHLKSNVSKSSKVKQRGKPPCIGCLSVSLMPVGQNISMWLPRMIQMPTIVRWHIAKSWLPPTLSTTPASLHVNCHVAWWSLCHRWRFRNHSFKHWKLEVAEIPRFTWRLLWRLLCRFLGGDEQPMATKWAERLKLAAVHGLCLCNVDVQGDLAAWKFSTIAGCTAPSLPIELCQGHQMRPAPVAWYRFQGAILPGEGYKGHVSNLEVTVFFSRITTSSSSTAARPSASVRRR